jgi:hypothetical protein
MTGFQSQLSPRLTLNASAGAIFANAWQNGVMQPTLPAGAVPFQIQSGAAKDWVADIRLIDKLTATTQLTAHAAQTVIPTITGQLLKTDLVGLTLSHDINPLEKLNFSTQFSHDNLAGTEYDNFTASASYIYQLTREWRTQFSYTYNSLNSSSGVATSSTVLFKLSRDFEVYGKKPPALNPTPANVIRTPADLIKSPLALQSELEKASLPAVSQ